MSAPDQKFKRGSLTLFGELLAEYAVLKVSPILSDRTTSGSRPLWDQKAVGQWRRAHSRFFDEPLAERLAIAIEST
jgi:hypothetical protein